MEVPRTYKRHLGFTLVELITTVAIIAILAGIAIPTYERYTLNSTRTAAKTAVERVRGLLESYYLNNKSYTTDATKLGFSSSPLYIEKSGEEVSSTSDGARYQVVIYVPGTFCTACAYEVGAIPQNGQTQDTECATIHVNSRNQKGATGTKGIKCW